MTLNQNIEYSRYLKEVEDRILKHSQKSYQLNDQGIYSVDFTVPFTKSLLKEKYSFFSENDADILAIWDHIWKNSRYFECMSQAVYYYQKKKLGKKEIDVIKKWTERCTCWQHSDDLSKIYADALELNPKWIFSTLKKWNVSKNFWERRQSVVSLLEYACKRKKVLKFEELIGFVKPLLDDIEYYVQKGVGWTLREIYNVYPKETLIFLREYLNQISPVAYCAATEKLDKDTKKDFNKIRKEYRKCVKQ